jgi:hypothetical protein
MQKVKKLYGVFRDKKQYHSIFTKFHKELELLVFVPKTLSEKRLMFKKILWNVGKYYI